VNVGDSVGSYKIVSQIGEGGMGSVYLAEHTLIGSHAAVKVLHSHLSHKEDQVNRFFNEARVTAGMKHPGILDIYDFGYHGDNCAYIVMEYLEGESLEARIQRLKRISLEHALHIVRQVAGALAAAHAQGVVHRDLKPENIFIVRDPEVAGGERTKILDFGIAKLTQNTSSTRTGALIGTPDYMAPEQCRGAGYVDHRADFYSLGCILFRMICGRPPFVGDGVGEVLAAHLHLEPPKPSALEPSIEPLLEGFILRLLAKDREERFNSAAELINELDAVWVGTRPGSIGMGSADGSVAVRPLGKGQQVAAGPSTISSAAMEIPGTRVRNGSSGRIVAISAAAALMVGVVGIAAYTAKAKKKAQRTAAAQAAQQADPAPTPTPAVKVDPVKTPEEIAADKKVEEPVEPEVKQVVILIDSKPDGAEVYRASDGVRVGKTPYRYSLDPVEGELVYMIKRDGYKSEEVVLPANQDGRELVRLKKKDRVAKDTSNDHRKPPRDHKKPPKDHKKPPKDHKKPPKDDDDGAIDPF
jgi:serine/threonine-protein kinase